MKKWSKELVDLMEDCVSESVPGLGYDNELFYCYDCPFFDLEHELCLIGGCSYRQVE